MSTIFADYFIVIAESVPDPLYVFKPELRQKTFTAKILEKDITVTQLSEWIPPENH
jgi:hypothetical protein